MIHLITFTDERMTRSADVLWRSALDNGCGTAKILTPADLSNEFLLIAADNLKETKGFGLYIWKPYIIWNYVNTLKDGDILIYSDCGVKIINNVNEIISRMDQDIFLFSNGHQHVHWCKMDVMAAICPDNARSDVTYVDVKDQQVQASVIFFKVNQATRDFIKEWMLWVQFPGFCDNSPSKLRNHPEFAEHRWDQAILTCLQIKYGYKLHWWADSRWYESQRHRWPEDKYPAMFDHHRFRNKGSGTGDVEWP